jgi:hypothetical protein
MEAPFLPGRCARTGRQSRNWQELLPFSISQARRRRVHGGPWLFSRRGGGRLFKNGLFDGKAIGLKNCVYWEENNSLACPENNLIYKFSYACHGNEEWLKLGLLREESARKLTRTAYYSVALKVSSKNAAFHYDLTETKKKSGKAQTIISNTGSEYGAEMRAKVLRGYNLLESRGYIL